ncbi:hypothetical protein MKW92_012008 [Papaver armeniacum]|nr:hypothetical protein MKW92_012008 [Papaver armeniacum]
MTGSMDEHYRVLEVQVPVHANTCSAMTGLGLKKSLLSEKTPFFCQVTSMHSLNDHSSILKEKLPVGKITGLKFLITVLTQDCGFG